MYFGYLLSEMEQEHMDRGHKFNPAMVERLSDPDRLAELSPERILAAAGFASDGGHNSAGRRLVDLGAGPGIIARGISDLVPEATVYALDISKEMVQHVTSELSPEEQGRVIPRLSDESHIALEDDSAELLYMVDVYHELSDAAAVLAEARRVLAPGGTLLVIDWARGGTVGGPPQEHRVPVDVLESEVSEAGFADVTRSNLFAQHHAVRARV